jgi:sulfur carrier protein ThiS adenylyltransferase
MKTERSFFARHDPAVRVVLRAASVGIAGAGGLGSNVAVALARAGVGRIVIADFDTIEITNLNRQQYFIDQVGRVKVLALRENLMRINPFSRYVVHRVRVTRANAAAIFSDADLLVEAFDRADQKQMLIETWLDCFPGRPIIAASGLSGYGGNADIRQRKAGNLYICGDEKSGPRRGISPMAPRVALVAAMQANLAIELLMKSRSAHVQSE